MKTLVCGSIAYAPLTGSDNHRMYLVAIAWIYVALMMAVAEATHSTGTLLGALITFVLYGLLPVALVVYLLGTPARRRARRAREAAEHQAPALEPAAAQGAGIRGHETAHASESSAPNAGGQAPAGAEPGAVAPVRKEA